MATSSVEEYENTSQIPEPGNKVLMGLPVATSSAEEYENTNQIPELGNRVLMGLPVATSSAEDYENASQIQEQGNRILMGRSKSLSALQEISAVATPSAQEYENGSQILVPEKGSGASMRRRKKLLEATSSNEEDKDTIKIAKPDIKTSSWRPAYSETEKGDYWRYIPLYRAALQGDWEAAAAFFVEDKDAVTAKINEYSETALHVAAGAGRSAKLTLFVQELVNRMPPEALEIPDLVGRTPLHAAAWVGNTESVEVISEKRVSVLHRRAQGWSVLDMAARNAKKDTLLYLLDVTKDDSYSTLFPDDDSAAHFLILLIASGYYDIALDLVGKYPNLVTAKRNNGDCGLKALARKVSAFKSGSNHQWWQRIIYNQHLKKEEKLVTKEESTTSHIRVDIDEADENPQVTDQRSNWGRHLVEYFWIFGRHLVEYVWIFGRHLVEYFWIIVPCTKSIQDQKKMHLQALQLLKCLCAGVRSLNNSDAYNLYAKDALLTAAKLGIHEAMEEIVESFPHLIWAKDEKSLNLLQIAVEGRHANVFNLIYQMGASQQHLVQMSDPSGNNLLHLAGKLAPRNENDVPVVGAALQMQRELQWFEEVKRFSSPRDIDLLNKAMETPRMLFIKEHKELRAEGEKWMKRTANSCTIPAALIVTVVFAAAIIVPGGLDSNGDGLPVFSKKGGFHMFAVFNAISLCAAITSLLVSLSILTSRYAQDEFLSALPNRLVFALVTLYLSITAMAGAFSSALYIMLGNKNKPLILCLVVAVAVIPIISFAYLEFYLLVDLIVSTYRPRIFHKQSNRPFY